MPTLSGIVSCNLVQKTKILCVRLCRPTDVSLSHIYIHRPRYSYTTSACILMIYTCMLLNNSESSTNLAFNSYPICYNAASKTVE